MLLHGEIFTLKKSDTKLSFKVLIVLESIKAMDLVRTTKAGANEYLSSMNLGCLADFEYTFDYVNPVTADRFQESLIKRDKFVIVPVSIPIDVQKNN